MNSYLAALKGYTCEAFSIPTLNAESTRIETSLAIGLVTFLSSTLYFSYSRSKRLRAIAAGDSSVRSTPWPKVPNAKPLIGNKIEGGAVAIVDNLEHWADLYGSEHGMYECNLFGKKLLVICDEGKLAQLDKHRPYNVTRVDNLCRAINSIGADGVVTAEGEVWKKDRRLVGPFLNRKNVRDYLCFVREVASRLASK